MSVDAPTLRILSASEMRRLLPMSDVIAAIEQGFLEYASSSHNIPARTALSVPEHGAVTLFMPVHLERSPTLGAKIVSVYPDNPGRGLPVVTGFFTLCDAGSGRLLAVMDATWMTGARTAATSAVATRHLARPDARILGVFGAGTQAGFHIEAMLEIMNLEEIRVFNRNPARAAALVKEMSAGRSTTIRSVSSPEECVEGADVLVTCTASTEPLFPGHLVAPGTHINAIGAFTPAMRELESDLMANASVFVDTLEGALAEAGDLLIPMKEGRITERHIRGELAEVISGTKPGRQSASEITVFKSVGFAMEDLVTARLAYEKALKFDIGQRLSFP